MPQKNIDFTKSIARDAKMENVSVGHADVTLGKLGGGVTLEGAEGTDKRYIVGYVTIHEDHSAAMMLRFYTGKVSDASGYLIDKEGAKAIGAVSDKSQISGLYTADADRMHIRFGLLPHIKTKVCFDLNWLDNGSIFTNRTPGTLKLVIHGLRTNIKDVKRIELGVANSFHDIKVSYEDFFLTDEFPKEFPLPDVKLVDEFGQWKPKDWPGKVHNIKELKEAFNKNEGAGQFPFKEWNKWGGDSTRQLKEGTGFFSTAKTVDGRWHLVDPDGCDYFSLGPCGMRMGNDSRIDSFEKFCDWLPGENDPVYSKFYRSGTIKRNAYMPPAYFKTYDFVQSNLYKVFGEKYKAKWEELTYNLLVSNGINSQGNGPGFRVERDGDDKKERLPYVRQIQGFPVTDTLIFRDFPDVLSPQYKERSESYAKALEDWKDDPWLIGYFLRNEPEYNFVPNLKIVDEVLHNPAKTYCKDGLINFLKERYGSIEKLNAAWGSTFKGFEDLEKPLDCCSMDYPKSEKDIVDYSIILVTEYIRIPAEECRKVDKNHLNLGLRWSKADNIIMMSGWKYFDVFSINCYSFDPTKDMDFVKNSGVDLPIILGEFHCGALDRGLPATGLKGVENQHERGVMWRHFVEKVAAHPHGVGAHWFQYNDQFCLGRFDGENYQIGVVDVCMQPHKELLDAAKESSAVLYKVKNGEIPPFEQMPKIIPMIGY
jgi:hypothetical protein